MRTPALLIIALLLPCCMASAQGSLLLVGGGSEDYNDWSDAPYRWLVTHAPNRTIAVLNYEDTTSFFSAYLPWLSPCTVINRAITTTGAANDSATYRFILGCDGIFLRGGDQWQYVTVWRGTLAEQAIREVYARGGVVGGTSAGEAVLSEIIFDARQTSVSPRTALRAPLAAGITLTDDFLGFGANLVADSHFFERGRLGRLPAFLAVEHQKSGREITGVGVEYGTALAIGPDGEGEVMGSGTVTLLRYQPGTSTILAAGAPLSMHGLRFDQLTAGARFNIKDGTVTPSPDAFAYDPVRTVPTRTTVILDGGNAIAEWSQPSGSLAHLQSLLIATGDTVGIIASASNAAVASSVAGVLAGRSVEVKMLQISDAMKNDAHFAADLGSCRGVIFSGNAPDSLAAFLDSTTLAGQAFGAVVTRRSPLLFLSDDVMLAGEQGIGQMYKSIYGAYYGYLTSVRGLGVLRGVRCVPRLYEASDDIDNRASGLFWLMAQGHCPFGILLDNGSQVTIDEGGITASGATPAMVVDARGATHGSVPAFRDPGKANPRQLGGFIHAEFSVVRDGEVYQLDGGTPVQGAGPSSGVPSGVVLYQNYPNPFNPSTTIRYALPSRSHVALSVCNALGQIVAVLEDGEQEAGVHERLFGSGGLASGVYWCILRVGVVTRSQAIVLMR